MTQKIKNQSYYFTNGGSGVELSNLVLICEKKIAWERATEERELEKRELQRGRERDREESYREEERAYWFNFWESERRASVRNKLDCFTENRVEKQLTVK